MNSKFNENELGRLDLNLLMVFSALMREGSVARAAERLFVGSSAVSMALGRLRRALDDPLFVRAGSSMEPTPVATAFWTEIEPALILIERAVRTGRGFDPTTSQATIRFAAPDDLEFVLVPRLLQRLTREAPGVRLIVRPADFRHMIDRLDSADADCVLSAVPSTGLETRHRSHKIQSETFGVLHDPIQLRVKSPIDLKTWLETPQVMLSIAGDLSSAMDRVLSDRGLERQVFAAVHHFPTIPFILRSLPSIANVPLVAARYFSREYGLALSPLPLTVPPFDLSLAWHVRTDTDPAQSWFRSLVLDVVREVSREFEIAEKK